MNMTDYLEKNKVINLLEHNDKVCHYSDKRYEGVVYGTVKALCMVIAEAPAADVQHTQKIKDILIEISSVKRNIKSDNNDYLTGYISALSAVEGMLEQVINPKE